MKTLWYFLKQKMFEIWRILTFRPLWGTPDKVIGWVLAVVYGPLSLYGVHKFSLWALNVLQGGEKFTGEAWFATVSIMIFIAALIVLVVSIYQICFQGMVKEFKQWLINNWYEAKDRVAVDEVEERIEKKYGNNQ